MLVPTPPVFYYSDWIFQESFRKLIFTLARSEFAVYTAVQFLRVATDGVVNTFRIEDRVEGGKSLLIGWRPAVTARIDYLDIKEMVYDYSYDLAAFPMT